MEWETLTEGMKELLGNLRHASGTIEYDIQDALDDAEDEVDFINRVDDVSNGLVQEAQWWIEWVRLVHEGASPPY